MDKELIVLKYGGSSVSDENKIKRIAQYVKELKSEGNNILIVVSAMGKQTDSLINMAYNIAKNPPKREIDMLLTTGERISMALLSIALNDIGVNAISFTGSQSGIITDCSHTKAKINQIKPYRILDELKKEKVVIVAGFQGVSFEKEITTLGRGGSDLTAIALAISLNASKCYINTDVDGIYPVDPRIVNDVKPFKTMSFFDASLFASTGAKVMHDRACSLASLYKYPYYIKSSFNSNGGTFVMDKLMNENVKEKPFIKGITSKKDLKIFIFNNIGLDFLLDIFDKNDINIYSVFTDIKRSILIIEDYEFIKNIEIIENEIIKRFNPILENGFIISILGEGFNNFPGSINLVKNILRENNYEPIFLASFNLATSIIFNNKNDHDSIIKSLYEKLKSFFIEEF
ncbi:MAG: aspartate kinase [Spirochaetes bacterium]|nr:aspartate kinase [Spirochaetota bacterium]